MDTRGKPIAGAPVCFDEYMLEFWMGDGGSSSPPKHHKFIVATDEHGDFHVETKKTVVRLVEIRG